MSTSKRAATEVALRVRSMLLTTLQTLREQRDGESEPHPETRPLPAFEVPFEFGPADASGRRDYRVIEEIGRGQSACVYRGIFQRLSTDEQTCDVAIKFYREIQDPRQAEEARLEALRADRVRDDRVVRIRYVDLMDGKWPYVVQDFHRALNLEEWATQAMKDRDNLPSVEQCARIVLDAARAVHAAHECNIIHRDIAPRNLLVCADGVTRITDFGCAALGERSSDTMVVGTPGFMPPEQWLNGAHLCQSDVAALAGILHWLVTGTFPYGESKAAIARAHEDPATAHQARADALRQSRVPDAISAAILQATHPNLLERTRTAADFADALEAWLDPVPQGGAAASSPRRFWGRLVGGTALIAAIGVGAAMYRDSRLPIPMVSDAACAEAMGVARDDPAFVALIQHLFTVGGFPFDSMFPTSTDAAGGLQLAERHQTRLLAEPNVAIRIRRMLGIAVLAFEADDDERCATWLAMARDLMDSPAGNLPSDVDKLPLNNLFTALQALRWIKGGGVDRALARDGSTDAASIIAFKHALNLTLTQGGMVQKGTTPTLLVKHLTEGDSMLEALPSVKTLPPPTAPPTKRPTSAESPL